MGLLDEPESFQVGHKQVLEALTMQTTESRLWSGDGLIVKEDHTGMRIAMFNANGKMANQLEEIKSIMLTLDLDTIIMQETGRLKKIASRGYVILLWTTRHGS